MTEVSDGWPTFKHRRSFSTQRMIRSFVASCLPEACQEAGHVVLLATESGGHAGWPRSRGVLADHRWGFMHGCVWILSTRPLTRSRSGSILGRGRSSTPTFKLGQRIARRRTAGRLMERAVRAPPRRRRPRGGRPRDAVVVCVKRSAASRTQSDAVRRDGVEAVSVMKEAARPPPMNRRRAVSPPRGELPTSG